MYIYEELFFQNVISAIPNKRNPNVSLTFLDGILEDFIY